MRRLFEGGVTNAETLAAGGDYSRAATIRGRRLIDEIRYVTSWRCPRKFNSFAAVMHDLAVKFVQEVSTSAARFFAAESLLVLVSLSLSGVSLRLSGLLA